VQTAPASSIASLGVRQQKVIDGLCRQAPWTAATQRCFVKPVWMQCEFPAREAAGKSKEANNAVLFWYRSVL